MKLVLPLPEPHRPIAANDGGWTVTLDAGVTLVVSPLGALARDVAAWRDEVVAADGPGRVVAREDAVTDPSGWPFTLVTVERSAPAGAPVERRLYAFFELALFGAVAILRGPVDAVRAVEREVTALLRRAVPDFAGEEPSALHEVWDGVDGDEPR